MGNYCPGQNSRTTQPYLLIQKEQLLLQVLIILQDNCKICIIVSVFMYLFLPGVVGSEELYLKTPSPELLKGDAFTKPTVSPSMIGVDTASITRPVGGLRSRLSYR